MELPEFVAKTCYFCSGRKLFWKIQESEKGNLIQLVQKAPNSLTGSRDTKKKSQVCSNWNNLPASNRQSMIQKTQCKKMLGA